MQSEPPTDVAIIGAGPTGLFAAYYAGVRQMTVKLIDSLDVVGGQLTTLYPEKFIYDVPGFPKVTAKELARGLAEQALQYHPTLCLGEQVGLLDFDGDNRIYTLQTAKGAHRVRSIVIAAGMGAFQPKRLSLTDAERYEGRGLHYSVQNLERFRDRRVLIVGGGDSAVDWANMLVPVAASVTLIHRRDQFRAHEESVARMRQTVADVRLFYELKSIDGDINIESAMIYNNITKKEELIAIDEVLVNIGFNNSLGPIRNWELDLQGSAIAVDSMMQTSRPGIFAAGDICTYPGKLKLIATGFGEAAIAVNYAKHFLEPSANIFPGHSTSRKD